MSPKLGDVLHVNMPCRTELPCAWAGITGQQEKAEKQCRLDEAIKHEICPFDWTLARSGRSAAS